MRTWPLLWLGGIVSHEEEMNWPMHDEACVKIPLTHTHTSFGPFPLSWPSPPANTIELNLNCN